MAVVLCVGVCVAAHAQSDDMPLGDVARSYRKSQAPPDKVIDNDNLPQVMDQGETRKWAAKPPAPPKPAAQLINFQSPNITCALSFNGSSPDALANAPRPERLPDEDVAKLEGPASLVGDTLEVSFLNGSAWDVREITVGLTIVRKVLPPSAVFLISPAKLVPSVSESSDRKQPDTTIVYHLHGTASPYSSAVFREVIDRPLAPDEEWHWAILQAKGLPPTQSAEAAPGAPGPSMPLPAENNAVPPQSSKGAPVQTSGSDLPKK